MNYIKFKLFNFYQTGGTKLIDLVNLMKNNSNQKGPLEIHSDQGKKTKFFPMYTSVEEAVSASPTKGCHLVIPGLLPANGSRWKDPYSNEMFFMPNDVKPHFHGDATHHNANFDIKKVYIMTNEKNLNIFNEIKDVYDTYFFTDLEELKNIDDNYFLYFVEKVIMENAQIRISTFKTNKDYYNDYLSEHKGFQ